MDVHKVLIIISVISASVFAEKKLICYYGTWATYRSGYGKFDVSHIDASLCTHIVYTFAGINSQGTVVSLDPYLDLPDNWGRDNFRNFNALKQKNPRLKTILAVGGWNEGSAKYSIMAASPTYRKNFISSAIDMLMTYGFDGLDIDWEYPNRRGSVNGKADIENFTILLKEMKAEFDKYSLLITAAVASTRETASMSYDIPAIAQYLDIVGLMTYDMYGPWDAQTGHNSPLHQGVGDENAIREDLNTIDVSLEYWLSQGFPPEKLIIGLPFFGHTFTLVNPNDNSVRSPSYGPGLSGPHTSTSGNMGYNEICSIIDESWDIRFDDLAKVPYAVQNRNWISFDDANSLAIKTKYALNQSLAGVMIWSIETDDFHGLCHGEKFHLLHAVKKALNGETVSLTTTLKPSPTTVVTESSALTSSTVPNLSSTTSATSTTHSDATEFVCKDSGMFPNPSDCGSFYVCVASNDGTLVPNYFLCPSNLYWDQILKSCNYPNQVICNIID